MGPGIVQFPFPSPFPITIPGPPLGQPKSFFLFDTNTVVGKNGRLTHMPTDEEFQRAKKRAGDSNIICL
jgi:hypothetical protein